MSNCQNPYCQADNPDDAKYCHMCGQKLYENKYIEYLKNNKNEILYGMGTLGIVLLILGVFGIATFFNAALGSCMFWVALLLINK